MGPTRDTEWRSSAGWLAWWGALPGPVMLRGGRRAWSPLHSALQRGAPARRAPQRPAQSVSAAWSPEPARRPAPPLSGPNAPQPRSAARPSPRPVPSRSSASRSPRNRRTERTRGPRLAYPRRATPLPRPPCRVRDRCDGGRREAKAIRRDTPLRPCALLALRAAVAPAGAIPYQCRGCSECCDSAVKWCMGLAAAVATTPAPTYAPPSWRGGSTSDIRHRPGRACRPDDGCRRPHGPRGPQA